MCPGAWPHRSLTPTPEPSLAPPPSLCTDLSNVGGVRCLCWGGSQPERAYLGEKAGLAVTSGSQGGALRGRSASPLLAWLVRAACHGRWRDTDPPGSQAGREGSCRPTLHVTVTSPQPAQPFLVSTVPLSQLDTDPHWILCPARAIAHPHPQIAGFPPSSLKASPHPCSPVAPPPFLQYTDESEF